MQIWLIRHGMTQGNREKRYIGRTDESILPEERIALDKKRIQLKQYREAFLLSETVLYSSPLRRCLETAELLFPELPVITAEELRECDFGELEYKNYQELQGNAEYQRWIDRGGTLPFPNGESQESFQSRCVECFRWLLEKEREKKLMIFVVHGGTIMSLMSQYALPRKSYFEWQTANGCGFVCEWKENDFLYRWQENRVDKSANKGGLLVCQCI